MGATLKFWQRSRVPKKGSRDEAVEIPPARKPGILSSLHLLMLSLVWQKKIYSVKV